ncbi:MAG: hypothetical protein H7X97_05530, partial [Opitutaceae bacterium]|nr:hypothetical protein [Verrucomicrobiales bacterium]
MRSRRKWFVLLLAGIVVGIVAWKLTREPEPVYKDRRLSEWVLLGYYPVGIKQLAGRREAIRHVGTNAVPHLLKWISHETPEWRTDLGDYLSGSPWPLSAQLIVDLVVDRRSEALAFKAAYCFRDL